MNWIRIEKLHELTGIPIDGIYKYKSRGIWIEGIHWVKRQGRLYFSIKAIERWVEGKAA